MDKVDEDLVPQTLELDNDEEKEGDDKTANNRVSPSEYFKDFFNATFK